LVATIITIYFCRPSKSPASVPLPPSPPQQPLVILYRNTFSAWYDDTKEAVRKLIEDERYRQLTKGELQMADERYSKVHEEG
jgi:hypothetical protein